MQTSLGSASLTYLFPNTDSIGVDDEFKGFIAAYGDLD